MNTLQIRIIILYFLSTSGSVKAQDSITLNQYGLQVIRTIDQYCASAAEHPNRQLVSLNSNRYLQLDLRYATSGNFLGVPLYPPIKTTFLCRAAASKLELIQQKLNESGLGLKIFDAYRPYSVTEKMWEKVPDDRYAANPKNGSGHNRGVAVDLTLIEQSSGVELDMGTGFDNFSDTAHHAFTQLPDPVLRNRKLLRTIMEKHGFVALETEWWHYSLPDARQYPLLDLSFQDLAKVCR